MQSGMIGRRKGTRQFKSQDASKALKAEELQVAGTCGVRFKEFVSRELV